MKQTVFKKPDVYGIMRKAMLSVYERGGKKVYWVAYFQNPDDLSTKEGWEFTKRKDAMYSIECHLRRG